MSASVADFVDPPSDTLKRTVLELKEAFMAIPYHPAELHPHDAKLGHRYVWELPVRLAHWLMAVAITVLFATGLFIAWPIFSSSGAPYNNFLMGRFREVHVLAGYGLLISFIIRGYWFAVGNKY